MLLLSQEFSIPDVIRLWDSLFADPDRFNYLNYVCVTVILTLRKQLMQGDFADCMELLQRFPDSIELRQLLNNANTLLQANQKY